MTTLLSVEDIAVAYGSTRVCDGVSLTLEEGDTLGLVGGSGSGKTTLARAIAGLIVPAQGRVFWRGEDITRLSPRRRRAVGVRLALVFQDPQGSLNPRQPLWDIVTEPLAIDGRPRQDRRAAAERLLDMVALDPAFIDRKPHALSGGQRQRVAIARALCSEPELLILDEPTSALDVTVQARVLDLLADLKARLGVAWLFVTHDLHVMRRACDQVLVLNDGRVVESGAAGATMDAPREDYTRRLIAATPSLRRPIDFARFNSQTGEDSGR